MSRPTAAILDADGLRLSEAERAFFREADPWGFILFARNIDTLDQVRALTGEMRDAVGRNAPVLIDQEGGRVQRMGPPHWRKWPAPLDHVKAVGEAAERAIWLRYRVIAAELHAVGIDVNCAPTLDCAQAETHPFLRNRCFGSDPDRVAALGRAAAEGLLAGGILPVIKHMPGHGRATQDSHAELPTIHAPVKDLRALDFRPFYALRDMPLGMTAHIVLPELGPEPATGSPAVIRLIREELGFNGLLMSDDLAMGAMPGTPAERARATMAAGCDVALFCNAPLADRAAVAEAAGPMNDAACRRADAALQQRCAPGYVDIAALEAELVALTG
ncbi:beta-N-acetylhexosaminidase [Poseidonocella pacifica]|uniref:beta-N-acetylhexosaminidase n=1 Tax=Poseidonocella pacifica TaxID=871651 RepID=A0A1I0VMY3_9RHOB|nr:beta-N-acetylhexosaminidase [Poseidonocella pacifica]SFA76956.1 beta-N-acetylhexosaminidase [Poseidonocella pacifica]